LALTEISVNAVLVMFPSKIRRPDDALEIGLFQVALEAVFLHEEY
jgi:hypothetical protein